MLLPPLLGRLNAWPLGASSSGHPLDWEAEGRLCDLTAFTTLQGGGAWLVLTVAFWIKVKQTESGEVKGLELVHFPQGGSNSPLRRLMI